MCFSLSNKVEYHNFWRIFGAQKFGGEFGYRLRLVALFCDAQNTPNFSPGNAVSAVLCTLQNIYTVFQKNFPLVIVHIFTKYSPIFI